MYSFGDLKNNLKRLQACDKQMNILSTLNQTKTIFDQKSIKNHTIPLYLKIMHYLLVQYNPSFYKQVLDIIPNIKTIQDQKFVQSTINISRKLLNVNPKITAEQFLQSNKWIEKKLQFIVELCEGLLIWKGNNFKNAKNLKNKEQVKSKANDGISRGVHNQKQSQQDEQDQLNYRQITVKPTLIEQEIDKKSFIMNNRTVHQKTIQQKDHLKQTFSNERKNIKPNVFPKNMEKNYKQNNNNENFQQQFISTAKISNQNINKLGKGDHNEEETVEYVTRQELNDVLQMIATMNGTFNELVSKFNKFQSNVASQITNTNAKITLLEQNVRMIKQNL